MSVDGYLQVTIGFSFEEYGKILSKTYTTGVGEERFLISIG